MFNGGNSAGNSGAADSAGSAGKDESVVGGSAGASAGVGGSGSSAGAASAGLGGTAGLAAAGSASGGLAAGGSASGGSAGVSGLAGSGGAATLPLLTSYTGSGAAKAALKGKVNIGQEFTVSAGGIRVRELGVWDQAADGLVAAHTVTLFELGKLGLNPGTGAKAVPGGSVTVPAGKVAALEFGFRFAALPNELELKAGKYALVAYGMSDTGDAYGDGGNVPYSASGVVDGAFSPTQAVDAASPQFPNAGDQKPHASVSFRFTSSAPAFIRIMPLGASITDGAHGTDAGYRGPLQALFEMAHFPAQFVGSMTDNIGSLPADQQHHEGHSGYTVQGLQDNVNRWLGPSGSPADLILLLVGTNDIVLDNDADFAGTGARLSKLISTIVDKSTGLLPKAHLIVAQLPPLKPAAWAKRDLTYNAQVAQVVADHIKLGESVNLVDMYSVVSLDDLYTDGEHPVDSGYIKMAHAWFQAIDSQ